MSIRNSKTSEELINLKPQRKNFTALVIVNTKLENQLWSLHKSFNNYVAKVLREVFDARHGIRGEKLKKIFNEINGSKDGFAKLNAITNFNAKPGKRAKGQEDWYRVAQHLLGKKELLFDRDKFFPKDMTVDFRQKVFEMVGQRLGSHYGQIEKWKNEKEIWENEKEEWQKNHKEYFLFKKYFDEFISQTGTLRASRERWHKYLKFILDKGNVLIRWRNRQQAFAQIKNEVFEKYKSAPNKLIDLLFKENPELKALNALDRIWRENYERFKRRPSFTYPSPYNHPEYYSFKKTSPGTYRNLDILKGTVDLQIKNGNWISIKFRPDKRLLSFLTQLDNSVIIGSSPKEGNRDRREEFNYIYHDLISGRALLAEPRGIKLVFRREELKKHNGEHDKPYLYIAIDLFDQQAKPIAKFLRQGPNKRKKQLPEGLKILCTDFGQRDLVAITLHEIKNGEPVSIKLSPLTSNNNSILTKASLTDIRGLTIDTIATHERELNSGLSNMYSSKKKETKGSHIPKGKSGFERLRLHIKNAKENRYKNGAHIVLATALRNGALVIVVEWLENYRPTLEKPKRYNRRRMQWSVRAVQNFLEKQSKLYNLIIYHAPPSYTSQICYRCGSLGVRCILPTKFKWEEYYEHLYPSEKRRYIQEPGGNFFYCPSCEKLINADINASFNLAKVYSGKHWQRPNLDKTKKFWFYRGKKVNKEEFFKKCDNKLKQITIPSF